MGSRILRTLIIGTAFLLLAACGQQQPEEKRAALAASVGLSTDPTVALLQCGAAELVANRDGAAVRLDSVMQHLHVLMLAAVRDPGTVGFTDRIGELANQEVPDAGAIMPKAEAMRAACRAIHPQIDPASPASLPEDPLARDLLCATLPSFIATSSDQLPMAPGETDGIKRLREIAGRSRPALSDERLKAMGIATSEALTPMREKVWKAAAMAGPLAGQVALCADDAA